MSVFKKVKALLKDEQGISAVEYALLLALIGAGIAAAAMGLGGQVADNINSATDSLEAAGTSGS
jgi:pilus assembly protein Flp/PilA